MANSTHQIWILNQINSQGDTTHSQIFLTQAEGNTGYALIDAGIQPEPDTQLVELWIGEADDLSNDIISRDIVAWRALVPGAESPFVMMRETVDQELAQIHADLQAGLAPIMTPLSDTIIENESDLQAVINAIQKKISGTQSANTRDLNTVQSNSVSQGDAPFTFDEPSPEPTDGWIVVSTDNYITRQFVNLHDAVSYANANLSNVSKGVVTAAQIKDLEDVLATGLIGYHVDVGEIDSHITIGYFNPGGAKQLEQTTVSQPISAVPLMPVVLPAQPIDVNQGLSNTTSVIPAAQLSALNNPSGHGMHIMQQCVSPVVTWDDPFANIAGMIPEWQADRVRAYLDPLDPVWDFRNVGDTVRAGSVKKPDEKAIGLNPY
jgi:hypothetical protein